MPNLNPQIPLTYLITLTPDHLSRPLERGGHDPLWCWTSRFCGRDGNACSLGATDAMDVLQAVGRLVHKYRSARVSGRERAMVASIEALFWVFLDAIERCLDLDDNDCVCSWQRRIGHAEEMTPFLIAVARAYWSTGAGRDWMFRELECLACRANEVSERDGSIARRRR